MRSMRFCGFVAAAAFGLFACGLAQGSTVSWMGTTWDDNYNSPETNLNVNGSNQLEVSATTPGEWAAAHYNTDVAFRAAATPSIEFSFIDTLSAGVRKGAWIEDENTTPGSAGGWLQFDIPTTGNYRVYYDDYDADILDGGGIDFSAGVSVDTGVARTAGVHTFLVGRRSDGTTDFWIDGTKVVSLTSAQFNTSYFGDVYLSARDELATYTQYSTATNYVVPEPSSIALAFCAAVGLLFARRRKRA